jgi:hypothetical protein
MLELSEMKCCLCMSLKAKNLFALIKKVEIKNNFKSRNSETMMKLKMINQELQVKASEKRQNMVVVSY